MVHDRFEYVMPAQAEVVLLSMRTRFISFQRAKVAAATMVGRSFPFSRWSASMRHQPLDGGRSLMVYTHNFECGPRALRWLIEPVTKWMFDHQTRRRFLRMQRFLREHADDVRVWQKQQETRR